MKDQSDEVVVWALEEGVVSPPGVGLAVSLCSTAALKWDGCACLLKGMGRVAFIHRCQKGFEVTAGPFGCAVCTHWGGCYWR